MDFRCGAQNLRPDTCKVIYEKFENPIWLQNQGILNWRDLCLIIKKYWN
jgi:hypothetical protein